MTETREKAKAILLGYPFEVRPLAKEEGGGYLIVFPDLPGCISDGESIEEAMTNALDVLEGWLDTRGELKLPIATPSQGYGELGNLMTKLPKSLHLKLSSRAKQERVSVSTLVVALLAEAMARK